MRLGGPPRYEHQKDGLRRLVASGGRHALLWDPGTGKTRTVVDYCSLLTYALAPEARVLVIAPLAALDTWLDQTSRYLDQDIDYWGEIVGGTRQQRAEAIASRGRAEGGRGRWISKAQMVTTRPERLSEDVWRDGPGGMPGDRRLVMLVANYDLFSSRAKIKGMRSVTIADRLVRAVQDFRPDLLVLDESHKIKGVSSNVGRLVRRIARDVPRVVLMTGTVMPLGPQDVWGQWQALDPGAIAVDHPTTGKPSTAYGAFETRYVDRDYGSMRVKGFRNLDELRTRISPRAHVVRKEDALDLPPTTEVVVPVVLSQREALAYQQMKRDMVTMTEHGIITASNVLVKSLRLRQITSGFVKDDSGALQRLGSSKQDAMVSLIHDTLGGETRVVVFCFFRAELDGLADALRRVERNAEVMVISGSTPQADRVRMRRRFGTQDPRRMLMVAQVDTLNLAVNELVTASYAVFGSLPGKRDNYEQALARLDRPGQTRPVTYLHVMVPGSVDEIILDSHRQKTSVERALLAHIRSR